MVWRGSVGCSHSAMFPASGCMHITVSSCVHGLPAWAFQFQSSRRGKKCRQCWLRYVSVVWQSECGLPSILIVATIPISKSVCCGPSLMHQARRCASDGARKAADRASSDALLAAQARRRTEEVEARAAAAQAAQRMAAVETSKHTSDGAALAGAARVLHTRGAEVAARHVTQVPASPSMSGRHKVPHPTTAHASGGAGGGRGAGSSEGRHAAMDEDIGAMSVKEIKGELAWCVLWTTTCVTRACMYQHGACRCRCHCLIPRSLWPSCTRWGVDFASYSSQEDLRILLAQVCSIVPPPPSRLCRSG